MSYSTGLVASELIVSSYVSVPVNDCLLYVGGGMLSDPGVVRPLSQTKVGDGGFREGLYRNVPVPPNACGERQVCGYARQNYSIISLSIRH